MNDELVPPVEGPRAEAPVSWTVDQLNDELDRWERELRAVGKAENTVATYVGRSRVFVRWLAGEYTPR